MRILRTIFVVTLLFAAPVYSAEQDVALSSGETVYVAIYSNVFTGPKGSPFNLTATLSIRNTDLRNQLSVLSVEYFDNDGKKLREYLKSPITLDPVASHHISIKENDESGGFGANFVVTWKAAKKINPPIIQSIMIGTKSGQGISFVSRGQVINENTG